MLKENAHISNDVINSSLDSGIVYGGRSSVLTSKIYCVIIFARMGATFVRISTCQKHTLAQSSTNHHMISFCDRGSVYGKT